MQIPSEVKEIVSLNPKKVTISVISGSKRMMVTVYFMDDSRRYIVLDGDLHMAEECVNFLSSHSIYSLVGMID